MKISKAPCLRICGWLVCMLSALTTQAQTAKTASALQRLDDGIMIGLAEHRTPAQNSVMLFLSHSNLYVNAAVPTGLLVGGIISRNQNMRENALYVASSSVISYSAVLLIKNLVKRPRPYRNNIQITAVYPAGGYSFPSGHASSSMSTATSLSIAYPKWYVIAPALLWSSSVTYSRMYLGLHYPSDVATGSLFGAGTAVYLNHLKNRN